MKTFLCLFLILATVSAQRGKGGKGRPTNAPTEAPTNAPTEAPTAAPSLQLQPVPVGPILR